MTFTSNEWRATAPAYDLPVHHRRFCFHANEFVTSSTIWAGERFHWLLRHDCNARLGGSHRTSKRSQSEQSDNCHDGQLRLTSSRTFLFSSMSFCFSQNITSFHSGEATCDTDRRHDDIVIMTPPRAAPFRPALRVGTPRHRRVTLEPSNPRQCTLGKHPRFNSRTHKERENEERLEN
jgi:hypothetical protein